MDRAHADLVAAGKAQAEADTVFELERRAQVIAFQLGARERSDTNTGFDVRFDAVTGEFIDEYRRERQAVVAGSGVAVPEGVGAIPVAGYPTNTGLPPAGIPVLLQAQAIDHGGVAGLPYRKRNVRRLCRRHLPHCQSGSRR